MSKELVENCHYILAQKSKHYTACDIIDSGKTISVLIQDKDGSLNTFWVANKNKAKFRKLLKEALTL